MQQHHRDAIERWAAAAAADDEVLAVVVAGSLTKGYGRADSDGYVIVTDAAFARRRASGELTFFSTEFCEYEGGYVDAKYVDLVRVLAIERTPAAAEAVVMSLILFREWPQTPAGWSTQFMLDSEWNWLDGEPPIEDR